MHWVRMANAVKEANYELVPNIEPSLAESYNTENINEGEAMKNEGNYSKDNLQNAFTHR